MRPPVAVALVVVVAFGAGVAAARTIEVPPFSVGPDEYMQVQGVAAGLDGTAVFVLGDSQGHTFTQWTSATGTALAPAFELPGKVGPRRVVPDGNGGSIVAYTRVLTVANETHLFARRLDAMGMPIGAEFQVDNGAGDVSAYTWGVASLSPGFAFLWYQAGEVRIRVLEPDGSPRSAVSTVDTSTTPYEAAIAGRSDGGFAASWTAGTPVFKTRLQTFAADGAARSMRVDIAEFVRRPAMAGGPAGGFVLVGHSNATYPTHELLLRRFDDDANAVAQTVVEVLAPGIDAFPAIAADAAGNWNVVWGATRSDPHTGAFEGREPPRARPVAADGTPLEPTFALSSALTTETIVSARLPSGSFVNGWTSVVDPPELNQQRGFGAVLSLCPPDIRACGDGVIDGRCEECDDGAANSDATADACRTTCELPRCGDQTVDTGETCDDGGLEICDGCNAQCQIEVGFGCGDGMVVPGCAERCDDGNTIMGDGCTPTCTLERIPGGGRTASDCLAEWVANNSANAPRFDPHGRVSAKQRCVDGDARCDFDGGADGRCTFRIRVCANNTDVVGCAVPTRIASWQLVKPSAKQASKKPELAAVRSAFGAVQGAIVGPSTTDVCSDDIAVVVPLRGTPANRRRAKIALKAVAATYDDRTDKDTLVLTCDPAS